MTRFICFLFPFCFLLFSCADKRPPSIPMQLSEDYIIPKPVQMIETGSSFRLDSTALIISDKKTKQSENTIAYLQELLASAIGDNIPVKPLSEAPKYGYILLSDSANNDTLGTEGYDLEITEDFIKIAANSSQGVFYGIQSLRQLLPLAVEVDTTQLSHCLVPSGKIRDFPTYEYRGAMLDVSRHFFEVEEVKRLIDYLAAYKMNILHLHLTDDQGWRIEIKAYPKLTKHGGKTEVGGGKGGYFTQEDYKEIVDYAAQHFITIVPEIDMPGHTNAALSSYGFLNCDDKTTKMYTGMRVGFSSFCIKKDTVYAFLDKVIGEVAALTPGPYFHIGGDEAHATKRKDYIAFVEKVKAIVKKHDKIMLGWDDITAASLEPGSIAQHWEKAPNALRAKEQGLKIIMSPAKKAYSDMKYDSLSKHGLRWAGYIPVDTAYTWSPATYIEGINKEDILGVETPLWSETVSNLDEAEYLFFPRLSGYAEIGWTPDSLRNWKEYKIRLNKEEPKWETWGVDYFRWDGK